MSVSLHDLTAPQPRPRFRDELWERAEAAERRAARRRRAVAIGALACAIAASASAGVMALQRVATFTGTYDRTMSCAVPIRGGAPVVRLGAHSAYSTITFGKKFSVVAFAGFSTGTGGGLGSVADMRKGYGFPADSPCTAAASVPLAPSGLPLYEVYKPGEAGLGSMDNGATCLVGGHVRVRVHTVVRKDVPQFGQLALWTGTKKLRPVAFVDWAPKRVALYMSDDCNA